jgi:hypothetical protein
LTVFALKENKRPDLSSELYYSVFPNWGCSGDVKVPENPTPSSTAALEDLFFRSAFTDHNPPTLNGIGWTDLWTSLVGKGKTEFPTDCLASAGKVGDLFTEDADDFVD